MWCQPCNRLLSAKCRRRHSWHSCKVCNGCNKYHNKYDRRRRNTCCVITDRKREAQSAGIVFTHGPIWVFHPVAATRCTDQDEIWQGGADQISLWSAQGCGFMATKTLKIWNFTNIIAPKGRTPCAILTKFAGFMRVLSLYKSAKFGCFSSINEKIINNLPRWGVFQPNFWWRPGG